jgi:hypothetical protein
VNCSHFHATNVATHYLNQQYLAAVKVCQWAKAILLILINKIDHQYHCNCCSHDGVKEIQELKLIKFVSF